jgi:hypothetical protein
MPGNQQQNSAKDQYPNDPDFRLFKLLQNLKNNGILYFHTKPPGISLVNQDCKSLY